MYNYEIIKYMIKIQPYYRHVPARSLHHCGIAPPWKIGTEWDQNHLLVATYYQQTALQ